MKQPKLTEETAFNGLRVTHKGKEYRCNNSHYGLVDLHENGVFKLNVWMKDVRVCNPDDIISWLLSEKSDAYESFQSEEKRIVKQLKKWYKHKRKTNTK